MGPGTADTGPTSNWVIVKLKPLFSAGSVKESCPMNSSGFVTEKFGLIARSNRIANTKSASGLSREKINSNLNGDRNARQ
jgi:hypothetical protein